MGVSEVKEVLSAAGLINRYIDTKCAISTVELAARDLDIEPGRVAKTLSFKLSDRVIVVIVCGDARVDNKKFKTVFNEKARFLDRGDVLALLGHPVGGVCPFALPDAVRIYLDISLKAFDPVYPAAGSEYNAVRISLDELAKITKGEWVDVCQIPKAEPIP